MTDLDDRLRRHSRAWNAHQSPPEPVDIDSLLASSPHRRAKLVPSRPVAWVAAAVIVAVVGAAGVVAVEHHRRTRTVLSTSQPISTTITDGSVPPAVRIIDDHRRADALRFARSVLARTALPPRSTPTGQPDAGRLRHPFTSPTTTNLEQATRFALTSESVTRAVSYVLAHAPRSRPYSSSNADQSSDHIQFDENAIVDLPAGINTADLLVDAAAVHGTETALRIDVQVTWLPAVPAYDHVPAADRYVVVSVEHLIGDNRYGRPTHRRVVTTPAVISGLIRAANRLPGVLPGEMTNCPAENGAQVVTTLAASPSDKSDVSFAAGNCGGISVTSTGHPTAGLSATGTFTKLSDEFIPPGTFDLSGAIP